MQEREEDRGREKCYRESKTRDTFITRGADTIYKQYIDTLIT
jgi:hypothetical protein